MSDICDSVEGMDLEEAKNYVKDRGFEIRVEEKGGTPNFLTTDYREDRLTVKVSDSDVIKEARIE